MKLAILDVDGTLYPQNFSIALFKKLFGEGYFHSDAASQLTICFTQYKNKEITRTECINIFNEVYAKGIKNYSQQEITRIAYQLWEEEQENLFPFVQDLFLFIKNNGFTPVIISGSPYEIIRHLAEEFGVKYWWSTTFQTKDNHFTGEFERSYAHSHEKEKVLDYFSKTHAIDWNTSFALGDSMSDIGTMKKARFCIAIEPEDEFRSYASSNGIVIARKENLLNILETTLI